MHHVMNTSFSMYLGDAGGSLWLSANETNTLHLLLWDEGEVHLDQHLRGGEIRSHASTSVLRGVTLLPGTLR